MSEWREMLANDDRVRDIAHNEAIYAAQCACDYVESLCETRDQKGAVAACKGAIGKPKRRNHRDCRKADSNWNGSCACGGGIKRIQQSVVQFPAESRKPHS